MGNGVEIISKTPFWKLPEADFQDFGVPLGSNFGRTTMLFPKLICMVDQGIYGRGPPPLEPWKSEPPGEDNRRGREYIPHAW